MAANLLGLVPLGDRFEGLHASFQWQLERMEDTHPLRKILQYPLLTAFPNRLQVSPLFTAWKRQTTDPTQASLRLYIRSCRWESLVAGGVRTHLLDLIPRTSRLRSIQFGADGVLLAGPTDQWLLLKYRRGAWNARRTHTCGLARIWHRGDEGGGWACVGKACLLTREEERERGRQDSGFSGRLTVVDFLLNRGEYKRAAAILRRTEEALRVASSGAGS